LKLINQFYINGKFVVPNGTTTLDLINPSTKEVLGQVTLGNVQDAQQAIAAAKEAFKTFSKTTISERCEMLQRLYDAVMARSEALTCAAVEEYGSPVTYAGARTLAAAKNFLHIKEILQNFEFVKYIGKAKVILEPLGVVGLITPWNSNHALLSKLASAIAAGCTVVIKPSELSAIQTQLLTECFHNAEIPDGIINIVHGTGEVIGAELTHHSDVAMISFTGSTQVGKTIRRGAVDTMKRVTLELGGKSPNIILDDADFTKAIPLAIAACFMNNGQACIAGTRLIIPEHRLEEVKGLIRIAVEATKVGDPQSKDTVIGPLVSQKQYDRVQHYIKLGIEEGAELVTGGLGHPKGLENGFFVKPTVFANVTMNMTIARDEIFGPVLSILTYKTEEEAIQIANDTVYGLHAYISSSNIGRANQVASQLTSGRIMINGIYDEPKAPFGGFKQSGIGREHGVYGLEEYMETKTIFGTMS
jgi:aldehyde dehydrogenase (NAD+)